MAFAPAGDIGAIDAINTAINNPLYVTPQPAPTGTTAPPPPPTPTVDPYAAYGGQAAYNSLVSGYNTQKDAIHSSAGDAASNYGLKLDTSIHDFLNQLGTQQHTIDNQAVQAELAKKQGTQGVLGMVNRGIKSAGAMLSNRNATDSSAAEGLSNAYGDLGRRQLSSVGNQYATAEGQVNDMQQQLEEQRQLGSLKIRNDKQGAINTIVSDARDKLAALDAQIAGANLPNRIAIEQEKEAIRQQAIGALQGYDTQLDTGLSGIHASSSDDRMSKANTMFTQGQAPATAFQFTSQAPMQFQNTGPSTGALPIFTLRRGDRTA